MERSKRRHLEHLESWREYARNQERFVSLRDGARAAGPTSDELASQLRAKPLRPRSPLSRLFSSLLPHRR